MAELKNTDLVPTSFKFTPTGRELLERLAKSEGLSMTGFLETTLRKLAREKGITFETEQGNA